MSAAGIQSDARFARIQRVETSAHRRIPSSLAAQHRLRLRCYRVIRTAARLTCPTQLWEQFLQPLTQIFKVLRFEGLIK